MVPRGFENQGPTLIRGFSARPTRQFPAFHSLNCPQWGRVEAVLWVKQDDDAN